MRMNRRVLQELLQGWEKQLGELHPRGSTPEEKERVELATMLFNHEARSAAGVLISELKASLASEERLLRDLDEARRRLTEANRLIRDLRAKNRRLTSGGDSGVRGAGRTR